MTGILDSIDGALLDWMTSEDAMRWVPEEKRSAAPAERADPEAAQWWPLPMRPAVQVTVTVDTKEFARALNELGAAVAHALMPVVEDAARQLHALSAAFFPTLHRRCPACHPAWKTKPLAVDGHEYQRRLKARRKRRKR